MAVTKTSFEWTASSSLTQTVPFEVIAAGDIDVYVEGVLQLQQNTTSTADATHPQVVSGEITQGTALTNYTVASNNGSITFNAALTVDDFVVIERTTDDTLLETFTSGSTVRARDLNSAFERVLFIAQEGVNIANEALAPSDDEDDALDAKGERISNVADATDDDDAVNRAQLGKVITDDLVAGEGIDLTDVSGGTNSGKQVTVSAELSTAVNPGVVRVNATTPITATYTNPGQLDLSIENNSIDIGKIQTDDIITLAEQNAGSPNPADTKLFTSSAAAKRFDTLVQTTTPSGSDYQVGKTWLQNDDELTLSIWNGSAWTGIASGGTFTNQPKVVYVDASSGDDNNDGHRISRPKLTIKAAVNQINNDDDFGDGSVVIVAPGVYQEVLPIQIERKNVSIIGNALRSCIVHPTVATQESTMFELNSGSYIANLTLTGMKASGSLGNSVDAVLPTSQGWNFAFFNNAVITKSPYIQNCTNFSDSEIDNSNLNANTPAGGLAGDTDSAPTGGGLLVDGSVPSTSSPLRSIVCDSYTHVGLNGPGILVTNNGYVQATSSYAFFNRYHIKCLNGGQANLAASTTDFGDQALVADGKSTTAIFTANTTANAAENDITFTVGAQTAGSGWFGDTTRPGTNMLVELGGTVYPILSAVANGSGWDVTISRPDPNNRSENLGLDGAVTSGSTAEFFLRSMIASSGHTMEYVGSGTDYRALPENGGVPDETKQITELNDGKVWTAITDHNGKFKIGGNQTDDPIFEIDQQLGFVTIPEGSIAFNLLSDLTPQLGGNLDVNGNTITSTSNANVVLDPNGTGSVDVSTSKIINVTDPTDAQHAATKNYVDTEVAGVTTPDKISEGNTEAEVVDTGSNGHFKVTTEGTERMRIDSSGRLLAGTSTSTSSNGQALIQAASTSNDRLITAYNFENDASGPYISLGKSRGTSVGSFTILQNNDELGNIAFFAADGTDLNTEGARIQAEVDGTPGTNDMPTRLVFSTTADGANNPTERLRIDSSGNVGIGTSSPGVLVDAAGSNPTLRVRATTINTEVSTLRLTEDNSYVGAFVKYDGSTNLTHIGTHSAADSNTANDNNAITIVRDNRNVGIGTTSPNQLLHIQGSGTTRIQITGGSSDTARINLGDIDDEDIGQIIYNNSNDSLQFIANGAERMRIDSSGRLLVATTSSTANSNADDLQIGARTDSGERGITVASSAAGSIRFADNGNDTAGYIFYSHSDNSLRLGADGSERLRIDSSGRLLLGTTTEGESSADNLTIADSGDCGITIRTGTSSSGRLFFSDGTSGDDEYRGFIQYGHSNNAMLFGTNATERMRVDSSGNVLVGTTNNARGKLTVFNGDGFSSSTLTDGDNIYLISDATSGNNVYGASIAFSRVQYADRKHAAIAAVQTSSDEDHVGLSFFTHPSSNAADAMQEAARFDHLGRLLIGLDDSFNTDAILQVQDSGNTAIALGSTALSNNQNVAYSCRGQASSGGDGYRLAEIGLFKNSGNSNPGGYFRCDEPSGDNAFLWVDNSGNFRISNSFSNVGRSDTGTVVGTQSSDERVKNVGEAVAYGLSEIKQLQPKQFAYKKDPDVNKLGFIAQEVESIIPEAVFDTADELEGHQEGDRTKLGMEYVQLIPVLVNAVKELSAEVDTLKAKVAALEAAE